MSFSIAATKSFSKLFRVTIVSSGMFLLLLKTN